MNKYLLKLMVTVGMTCFLSSCMTPKNDANEKNNDSKVEDNRQVNEADSSEYVFYTEADDPKANYRQAAKLYAELTITYTQNGYLDMAKDRLIRAKQLEKDHGYNEAIVDYAAGYYYQKIGSKSVAEKYYEKALDDHPNNYEAMNFYAQFLCQSRHKFADAEEMFEKSLYMSDNNDMAQSLFLYSECMSAQGKGDDALILMERADKFRQGFLSAKLHLAEMYFDKKRYKDSYKVIYGMKSNKAFFNNKRILELRLKLAEYANNKNEAAQVRLIFSSNDFNDDSMDQFFAGVDNKDNI